MPAARAKRAAVGGLGMAFAGDRQRNAGSQMGGRDGNASDVVSVVDG